MKWVAAKTTASNENIGVQALTMISLELEGIKDLPAVKWKLLNISRMDTTKHRKAVHKLRDYLGF